MATGNEVIDSEDPRKLVFEVIDEMAPKKVAEFLEQTDSEEPIGPDC